MKKTNIPVICGILLYTVIALWQGAEKPELLIQITALLVIFGIFAVLFKARDNEKLKCLEMAALWGCIYLFVLYCILKVLGVL
ncbi:MAG: hypothetical protein JXQ82_01395 [Methanomicrobiaceae archaeon]|nr:hypothetical protein [Methanomicrobiaceae archaeon]